MQYCTEENRNIVVEFAEKKGISTLEEALDMKVAFDVLELVTTPDGKDDEQGLYTDEQVEAMWTVLGWVLSEPRKSI